MNLFSYANTHMSHCSSASNSASFLALVAEDIRSNLRINCAQVVARHSSSENSDLYHLRASPFMLKTANFCFGMGSTPIRSSMFPTSSFHLSAMTGLSSLKFRCPQLLKPLDRPHPALSLLCWYNYCRHRNYRWLWRWWRWMISTCQESSTALILVVSGVRRSMRY